MDGRKRSKRIKLKTMIENITGSCVCSMRKHRVKLRHNGKFHRFSNVLVWTVENASKRLCGRESIDTFSIKVACEQALLFGRLKRVSRERARRRLSIRDFKIQLHDRQRERRLKSEFVLFQYLSQLFLPTYFVKYRGTLLGLNS